MAAKYQLSKKEILEEIVKCGKNPIYFIDNYARIVHPVKGSILFKTFPFQRAVLQDFIDYRFNIINKARQLGLSTLVAAYCAWFMLFHKDKSVLVLATKFDVAANLTKKVKKILLGLPPWLRISDFTSDNAVAFELKNGSNIKASTTGPAASRSEALSLLVIDEAAHIENLEDIWTSAYPTISCVSGGTLILTQNGFKKIEDLVGKDKQVGDYFEIKDLSVCGKDGLEQVSHGYVSPDSDTLVIKTRHGLELEVTKEHPLYKLVSTGGCMTKAKELNVGDYLRVDSDMQVFGNRDSVEIEGRRIEITNDFAYMIGGWLAEGWITKNKNKDTIMWISNSDKEFRDVYLNSSIIKPFHAVNNDKCRMLCCSAQLIELFKLIGVNSDWKCDTKQIPQLAFELKKELLCSLLRGLFDGDGCASNRGIDLTSTSIKMLQQVQLLLLNLGIVTSIHEQKNTEKSIGRIMPSGQKAKSFRRSWHLRVPLSQCKMFKDAIGFRISRKMQKLDSLIEDIRQDDRKQSGIPTKIVEMILVGIIDKFKSQRWLRQNGLRTDRIYRERSKVRKCNKEWIGKLAELCSRENIQLSPEEQNLLNELSYSCLWDEIVSISPSSCKTYDFTVPKTHSFLQNGILGSNTGGRCIAISTPNGASGWFYHKYIDSEAGINDFHHNQLMWDLHPERDEEWFANETKNMSQKQIAQELLCEFLASGQTVIDPKDIKWVETCVREPRRRDGYDRNIWIWKDHKSEEPKILCFDTARGDGADFSTFAILNLKTMEIDVEYQGKIDIDSFARMLMDYGKEYGGCMIVGENNNIGFAVLTKLIEWGYPNLYYSTKGSQEFLDAWEAENVSNSVVGFSMTGKTRPLLFAKFEEYIRTKQIISRSARFANELKTFIWNNGRPEAQKDCNDDLCCTYAFACWVRDTAILNSSKDLEYKQAMLGAMSVSRKSISTGLGDMRKESEQQKSYAPHSYDLPEEQKRDIYQGLRKEHLWILKG